MNGKLILAEFWWWLVILKCRRVSKQYLTSTKSSISKIYLLLLWGWGSISLTKSLFSNIWKNSGINSVLIREKTGKYFWLASQKFFRSNCLNSSLKISLWFCQTMSILMQSLYNSVKKFLLTPWNLSYINSIESCTVILFKQVKNLILSAKRIKVHSLWIYWPTVRVKKISRFGNAVVGW